MASQAEETGDNRKDCPVTLRSNDGKEFVVELRVAKMSETIKTMIENLGQVIEGEKVPINVHSEDMKNVICWAEKHKDEYKASMEEEIEKQRRYDPHAFDREVEIVLDEWDKKFYEELGLVNMYRLLMAANFLDVKKLIESVCKYIASLIKDKSSKDVIELFAPVKEYNVSIGQGTLPEKKDFAAKPKNSSGDGEKSKATPTEQRK